MGELDRFSGEKRKYTEYRIFFIKKQKGLLGKKVKMQIIISLFVHSNVHMGQDVLLNILNLGLPWWRSG